jgi:hypothetical protein
VPDTTTTLVDILAGARLEEQPIEALVRLRRAADYLRADLDAAIARAQVPAVVVSTEPDRAVGLKDAARLLGMSADYLYRHWARLGGYRDNDRRVKFPLSELQRHIRSGRPRA